ncbi:hypothetical protein BBD42_11935 [Paenibacillus sp. BIHB 4019]|uniref:Uncharacterized protein n=1 Tax=Paenibacillus sp. BIHB 4019 TaxID=1870819 RepID=A0A1B2DHC0_9BACL|nr:hypothetical protein [Paenibacillus sp. BIHB 4019]ANY67091.1 hypothetical protein BBD42_11935 [Paenibacillus sp. BIHB 4019]
MVKAIVSLVDGLNLKDPEAQLEITFDNEYLIIVEHAYKGFKRNVENTFKIPLANFLESTLTTDKDMGEVQKSVIGRGIVGGLIFGPAGLVLGGMSGIGTKKGKTLQVYIVSYVSSSGDINNITFKMPLPMVSVTRKFDQLLKKNMQLVLRSEAALKILGDMADQKSGPSETIL